MKKLISILLSVLLIISCVVVGVTASTNIYTINDVAVIDNYVAGSWETGVFQYHNKRIAINGYVEIDSSKTYTFVGTSKNHSNLQYYLAEFDSDKDCIAKYGRNLIGKGTCNYTPSSADVAFIAITITIQNDAVLAEDTNGIFNRFRNKGYSISLVVDGEEAPVSSSAGSTVSTVATESTSTTTTTTTTTTKKPTTSVTTPGDLGDKLTDTSDFALSSIELTEQMLVGYNIGNCFEMTELRPNYVRPNCSTIDELIYHKETMAGNVAVTEDYIKYLKSVGIQAIRLPVTWFNMLEDENGNIYPKDTWYGDLATRREAWYNGKINEEFLARVRQVVDWIIENDMYCIINTHHDGGCNNSNSILPIKMDNANKEQTYNYLTNIWNQVGTYFKDYGSKLIFEFYNETSDSSGTMTGNGTRDAFVTDLLCHLIPLIRNQGSNNANRFLVCPRYGGVSFWGNSGGFVEKFCAADSAEDKLIITTHTYTSASAIGGEISNARKKMTHFGIGAIIDEIGNLSQSTISEDYINLCRNLRTYSDKHKVSCFFWDNGDYDFTITNRYYLQPSSPSLSAYLGKELEYKTYTKSDITHLTRKDQPNWIELYTPDSENVYGKKYLIMTTANKITSFDDVKHKQGYYSYTGAEGGLVTYFDSDDGVNYTMRNTVIQTNWTKMAWGTFHVYGSTFNTKQIDGNYQVAKIGDGLNDYVASGKNLLEEGGEWQRGHYASNGKYEGEGTTYYDKRISLVNKISVTPKEYYKFFLTNVDNTRYQFILRGYYKDGAFLSKLGTITNGVIQIPDNIYYVSISLYDSNNSQNADTLFGYLENGTFEPTMQLYTSVSNSEFAIDMTTLTGASIRLNEKNGLRFYTEVDKQKVEKLRQNGCTVELGTLITAYDLIVDRDLNFDMAKGNMVYVPYDSETYYTDGSFSGIVGSLVSIKDYNLCRNFVARGYAKITDEDGNEVIVYADYDKTQPRNIAGVADAFIADETSGYADLDADKKALVNKWAKAND